MWPWSVSRDLEFLVIDIFVFFVFAVYLDNVVPNEYGRAKSPLFFLRPTYWGFQRARADNQKQPQPTTSHRTAVVDVDVDEDEDDGLCLCEDEE